MGIKTESHEDRVLLKIRRKYTEEELLGLAMKKVVVLQTELGKQKSYIAELEDKLKDDSVNQGILKKISVLQEQLTSAQARSLKLSKEVKELKEYNGKIAPYPRDKRTHRQIEQLMAELQKCKQKT